MVFTRSQLMLRPEVAAATSQIEHAPLVEHFQPSRITDALAVRYGWTAIV